MARSQPLPAPPGSGIARAPSSLHPSPGVAGREQVDAFLDNGAVHARQENYLLCLRPLREPAACGTKHVWHAARLLLMGGAGARRIAWQFDWRENGERHRPVGSSEGEQKRRHAAGLTREGDAEHAVQRKACH
eukprot:4482330-Prymnesium_polylepis.1